MQLASVWEGAPSHHCSLTMFGNSEIFFVLLSLLSLCFVIIIRYSRAQRGKTSIIPPSPSLSVALGLNGYFGVFLVFLSVLFYFLKTHQNPPSMGIQAPMDLGIHLC